MSNSELEDKIFSLFKDFMARYLLPLLVCFELHYEEFIFINILVCFLCVFVYIWVMFQLHHCGSIAKFEELVPVGSTFLIGFQHALGWCSALYFFFEMLLFALV